MTMKNHLAEKRKMSNQELNSFLMKRNGKVTLVYSLALFYKSGLHCTRERGKDALGTVSV